MRGARARADLEALARAHGVASRYEDARGRVHDVPAETIRAVLAAMAVACDTEEAVASALAEAQESGAAQALPPVTVVVPGASGAVTLHAAAGARVAVRLEQEDGASRPLVPGAAVPVESADAGPEIDARAVPLPADLPLGYHTLVATITDGREREERGLVVAAPPACPTRPDLGHVWGWALQLYALRSSLSWGIGDLADLGALATWSANELGADFVVANPLHAVTPVPPMEPSPYYPSSRRFANPLYVRVEDLPEFTDANPAVRRRVERLATEASALNRRDRIDRDESWRAKLEALELLRTVPPDRRRRAAFADFQRRGGEALETFATFCALAERHGRPWQRWPERLRHPRHPAVAAARADLGDRVRFHQWLQFCVDEQLAAVQRQATGAGMGIGVIHDLAVGADPGGADAWALQDDLAAGVTLGAPPDPFNQLGQDWRQPPLRPDRLTATGYAAFRDMLAPLLAHGGGVRLDHVMGLFRLWWIPEGHEPHDGTYVRYPAADLLAVLALEATRAGAIVIGEDLGTVEPPARAALGRAGVLSSRVVYFERVAGETGDAPRRARPSEYPAGALASATTHDLPTVAGWWADEDVRLRTDLGLLGEGATPEGELARKRVEREQVLALLRDEGLAAADAPPEALADALHAFLARSRARLVAVQPADAIGDLRQPNLPGTIDEYPNWRLPLAEGTPDGPRPILLEELMRHPRVRRLAALVAGGRRIAAHRGGTPD